MTFYAGTPCGTFKKTAASTSWVISHGFGMPVNVDVFVNANGSLQKIMPYNIVMSADLNSTTISFTTAFSGEARVIGLAAIQVLAAFNANSITWTYAPSLSASAWGSADGAQSIAYGNGTYVVVGHATGGSASAATSPDGLTWTYQAGLANNIGAVGAGVVIFDGTKFMVFGDAGSCLTSVDGVTWSQKIAGFRTAWGSTGTVSGALYTGSLYLAVGPGGIVVTSTDGITWTNQTSLSGTAWGTRGATALAWNGSKFLVVGAGAGAATSPDGVTWTYQTGLGTGLGTTAYNINTAVAVGTAFVVAGEGAKVATSADGITWTNQTGLSSSGYQASSTVYGMTWSGSQIMVVGANGGAATSPDGVVWTNQTGLAATSWGTKVGLCAIWNSSTSTFVVAGSAGAAAIAF